jgi:omega-amidase
LHGIPSPSLHLDDSAARALQWPAMRAAALQFDVRRGDVASNLAEVERGLREAAALGLELVVLPEMWPTSFPDAGADMSAELASASRAVARVSELSIELGLMICGTAFGFEGEQLDRARPPNRLRLIDAGKPLLTYDKVHLFTPTAEPEIFTPGTQPPPTAATRLGRIAGLICYDLRFPEITRIPWRDGAELVCIPAQWPIARAPHFRALCAGLAVANQCFVLGANRTGRDVIGRRGLVLDFPGNSLLVDPHGTLLAEGGGEPGLFAAELDLSLCAELRRKVPAGKDQRPDLYLRWR